jgi:ubiquinone biosynthesis protein UbiJ
VAHQRIDDIEEGLSRWVGDIAAHQIGRALRGVAGWGDRAAQTMAANVREYLQEESRDLIARPELQAFSAGVDEVSRSVDELAARVERLAGRKA